MTLTFAAFARLLRHDVVASMKEGWEARPDVIRINPQTWDDVRMAEDYPPVYWTQERQAPAVYGSLVEPTEDVPPDRIVVERWKADQPPAILWQEEFGEYALIVREGIAKAHPWLRLPGNPIQREVAPSRWSLMTAFIGNLHTWVHPQVFEGLKADDGDTLRTRRRIEEELRWEMRKAGIPEATADKVQFRWDLEPGYHDDPVEMWKVRPTVRSVTYPDVPAWAQDHAERWGPEAIRARSFLPWSTSR